VRANEWEGKKLSDVTIEQEGKSNGGGQKEEYGFRGGLVLPGTRRLEGRLKLLFRLRHRI